MSGPVIVDLPTNATHDLRRRVLRDDDPAAPVTFDGDDEPSTVHLGIEVDSQVVAVSTWMRRPFAERPEAVAVQLRGMATDPVRQGAGLGARLLEAGLDRARSDGADLVWARARSTALAFYLANGFGRVGDEFVDTTTGLPHVVVLHTFG